MKNQITFFPPMGMRSRLPGKWALRFLLFAILALGMCLTVQAQAADKQCHAHRQSGGGLFNFTCPGTCKINNKAGNCERRGQGTTKDSCYCIAKSSQKSCSISEFWQMDVPPGPYQTATLAMFMHPASEAIVWEGFDPNPSAVLAPNTGAGVMAVQFGSFVDPANVPVVITAYDRDVPSHPFYGMPTGPSHYSLLPGGNDLFFYNSLTHEFFTADDQPIYLLTSNDIRQNDVATLYLNGSLDGGTLQCEFLTKSYEFIEFPGPKRSIHESVRPTVTFTIVPNPAQSLAEIHLKRSPGAQLSGEWAVYNLQGQAVLRGSVGPDVDHLPLDLSGIASGMYQVVFEAGNEVYSQRLVVQP